MPPPASESPSVNSTAEPVSALDHLSCSVCDRNHEADTLQALSTCCSRPLLARYDLERVAQTVTPQRAAARPFDLWRYAELLPVGSGEHRLRLGSGGTPLLATPRLGTELGLPRLRIKDESLNPTASFKARGLGMAVSRAAELGVRRLAIPSAGNAAGAAAAYAAAAGLPVDVFMPADVPALFRTECEVLGASVHLVDGLITDCGARVRAGVEEHGWWDLSTLKEPYRLEGKKTMGYEIWQQCEGRLPDTILYPTGGGTGLIGIWKAFAELRALGWLPADAVLPRMVAVQSSGCAPIVRAFERGDVEATAWVDAATIADGLRVPAAVGDRLILEAIRESGGTAIAVDDAAMIAEARRAASRTGVFPAPEGAACMAAARQLRASGWLREHDDVLVLNTGSGLKYAHLWEA